MKQYNKQGISFQGESLQLIEQCKEYSFSSTYSEINIDDLSTKILNMTIVNPIVVSYADSVNAGFVNITFSQENGDPPIQVQKHDGFEIIFVANGSFLEIVGETGFRMEEFDAIIMNPNCKSMITESDNLIAIVVTISREYLAEHNLLKELRCLSHRSRFDAEFADAEFALFHAKSSPVSNGASADSDGISIQHKEDVKTLLYQLHDEMRKKIVGYDFIVPGLLKRLFNSLCNANLYDITTERETSLADEDLAEQIKNYLDETPVRTTVEDLTKIFHYNRNYLAKIFLTYTTSTINDYNRKVCMTEAKRLLLETKLPISTIAERVGYMSRSQFYSNFKKSFGYLPSEIRA